MQVRRLKLCNRRASKTHFLGIVAAVLYSTSATPTACPVSISSTPAWHYATVLAPSTAPPMLCSPFLPPAHATTAAGRHGHIASGAATIEGGRDAIGPASRHIERERLYRETTHGHSGLRHRGPTRCRHAREIGRAHV